MPYIAREEDYLAHHGIKGMRWGVRKDRSTGGSIRGKKKASDDDEFRLTIGTAKPKGRKSAETMKAFASKVDDVQKKADSGKSSYSNAYNELTREARKLKGKERQAAMNEAIKFFQKNVEKINREEFEEAKKEMPWITWEEWLEE